MQFFTRDWWELGCPKAEEVFARYSAHFAGIREALPPDLIELEEEHTLHDSEVKEVTCNVGSCTLTLRLEGWNQDLTSKVQYRLHFLEANEFEQVFPQKEYVERELGDLGYWECELVQGLVQMKMLFVSGAEFRVVFKDFKLEVVPR